jgi:hypothetical protein
VCISLFVALHRAETKEKPDNKHGFSNFLVLAAEEDIAVICADVLDTDPLLMFYILENLIQKSKSI